MPCRRPLIHLSRSIDYPWLPPIRFGVKPYLELCRRSTRSLAELEARYPSHIAPMLTLEASQQKKLNRTGRNKLAALHRPPVRFPPRAIMEP